MKKLWQDMEDAAIKSFMSAEATIQNYVQSSIRYRYIPLLKKNPRAYFSWIWTVALSFVVTVLLILLILLLLMSFF